MPASERWRLSALLSSAGATEPLAAALLGADVEDELAATRKLGQHGKAALLSALQSSDILTALVDRIWPEIELLAAIDKAATVDELHDKFLLDGKAFTLQLGGLDKFYGGLEGIVGAPNPQIDEGVLHDHCGMADATIRFDMPNGKMTTTSTIEWRFVSSPENGADGKGSPFEPYPNQTKARKPLRYEAFDAELKERNEALVREGQAPLGREEFLSARLYTGPMYLK